jgi:hypothetical protein
MNTDFLNLLKSPKKGIKGKRRKIEAMNQFGLQYIYTWKCHNETPHVANRKQKCLFFKNREQEGKAGRVWGLAPVEGRI